MNMLFFSQKHTTELIKEFTGFLGWGGSHAYIAATYPSFRVVLTIKLFFSFPNIPIGTRKTYNMHTTEGFSGFLGCSALTHSSSGVAILYTQTP